MKTEKELLREMKQLLRSGQPTDVKAARIILAQIGRKTKETLKEADKVQTKLF